MMRTRKMMPSVPAARQPVSWSTIPHMASIAGTAKRSVEAPNTMPIILLHLFIGWRS